MFLGYIVITRFRHLIYFTHRQVKMTNLSDSMNSIGSRFNDLNLDKSVLIDIPENIIFPNELNKFLKEKVEYLTYENGMLKKNVYDYENKLQTHKAQIDALMGKVQNYENTNEFASVANVARTKIVELSKRLRAKNSEVESWKSKCSKIEQELANVNVQNVEIANSVKDKKEITELQSEIKMLNDKFSTVNSRLFDEKNSNLLLKNELKLAHKLLQEEIGEAFESVQQIANTANWKGRGQIITDLQHKNNELKDKLKLLQDKEGAKCSDQLNQKKQIWEHKLDKAHKEVESAKAENSDLKKKFEAVRSRCKNIEIECSMWKTKCSSLSEQSERDRELIATITSQNSVNLSSYNELLKKKERIIEKLSKEIKDVKQDLNREACKVDNLEIMLQERDAELEKFNQSSYHPPHDSGKIDDRITQRVEAEQIRFAELIALSNQRLTEERDARCNAEFLHRQERQRAAKLEAKLARVQLGETTERGSSYRSILSKCSPVDNNLEFKLELAEENIKALQTRLAMEKREKEVDLLEFTKVLKYCKCSKE